MDCFYHPGTPAVGLCKWCSRGICRECAVELDGGLACRGRCEGDAQNVIDLIARNIKMQGAVRANLQRTRVVMIMIACFILAAGGLFLWGGLAIEPPVLVLAGLGGLLVLYGIFMVVRAARYQVPF